MSEADIAWPLGCSAARARSALAAARDAVAGVIASEGVVGEGAAAIQSAAVDAGGLDLGECKRCLALSLLQEAGGGVVMTEGAEGMRWADAPGGEVEVTFRRAPAAPSERQPASALLAGSVGVALGVMTQEGVSGAGAAALRVGPLPAQLHVLSSASSFEEAVEVRLAGSSPVVMPLERALSALGVAWLPVGVRGEATERGACDVRAWALAEGKRAAGGAPAARAEAHLRALGVSGGEEGDPRAMHAAAFLAGVAGTPSAARMVARALGAAAGGD